MCNVESDSISSLSCDECLRIAMPPHDVRKDVEAPRAATPAPKGKDVWLIDSGSEQDLISKAALRNASKAIRKQAPQPAVGQGRRQHGCPILCRSKTRAISRVFVVIHGGVLLLAAHYGAHVGERALVMRQGRRS